ncbi:MAG: alpha-1,2-fucosyltransferase [Janthinobacterium lividum]
MIITNIISGLGNQLFQYAVGKQLALTNNTSLKLNISFFNNQNLRSYKLDHFNIDATIIEPNELSKFLHFYTQKTLPYEIFRKFIQLVPRKDRKLFEEQKDWDYDEQLFKVSSDAYISGYWQNYKYFENLKPEILKELAIKSTYLIGINKDLNTIKNSENAVSVHVRRGDYITDKAANHLMGVVPLSYYTDSINILNSKTEKPEFYFFSDDLHWVKENFKGHNYHYINSGADYTDLHLMQNCKHNIIANSSFSWWGAFLNQNPDKIVIAPKNWVTNSEVNKRIEITFPSWIKL